MMLDGILDANGEYTGINPGHPVYPNGWFGKRDRFDPVKKGKVLSFLKQRNVPYAMRYDLVVGFAGDVSVNKGFTICADNWTAFKSFVDDVIGYVKPSKQKNE